MSWTVPYRHIIAAKFRIIVLVFLWAFEHERTIFPSNLLLKKKKMKKKISGGTTYRYLGEKKNQMWSFTAFFSRWGYADIVIDLFFPAGGRGRQRESWCEAKPVRRIYQRSQGPLYRNIFPIDPKGCSVEIFVLLINDSKVRFIEIFLPDRSQGWSVEIFSHFHELDQGFFYWNFLKLL